jgi:hypothetical protein
MAFRTDEKTTEREKTEALIEVVDKVFKRVNAPGIIQGLFGSYMDKEIELEDLINYLEDIAAGKAKLKDLVPVFNEELEIDHVADKKYELLSNYKPLFDENQNLVGFVPRWIVSD